MEQLWREQLVVFIVSTYQGGQPPADAVWFCNWLDDMATDFRVGSAALTNTRVAVFGCGSSVYGDHFNAVAKRLNTQLVALGAQRMARLGLGDDAAADMAAHFDQWAATTLHAARTGQLLAVEHGGETSETADTLGDGTQVDPAEEDGEEEEEEEYGDEEYSDEEEAVAEEQSVDIEDLAGPPRGAAASDSPADVVLGSKEMLNAVQRASLTKQVPWGDVVGTGSWLSCVCVCVDSRGHLFSRTEGMSHSLPLGAAAWRRSQHTTTSDCSGVQDHWQPQCGEAVSLDKEHAEGAGGLLQAHALRYGGCGCRLLKLQGCSATQVAGLRCVAELNGFAFQHSYPCSPHHNKAYSTASCVHIS